MSNPLVIQALALGVIVIFIAAIFFLVCAIAFPPHDDEPRGGGFLE